MNYFIKALKNISHNHSYSSDTTWWAGDLSLLQFLIFLIIYSCFLWLYEHECIQWIIHILIIYLQLKFKSTRNADVKIIIVMRSIKIVTLQLHLNIIFFKKSIPYHHNHYGVWEEIPRTSTTKVKKQFGKNYYLT